MPQFILEKISLQKMDSGHLCLNLTELVGWDQFPLFADKLTAILGTKVPDKAKSVEMRIWDLQFPTCQIMLVYDDFPQMVSLESHCLEGDKILQNLAQQLKHKNEL